MIKRKGFTLMELLAIIVVIAIIAMIAVPNVFHYIKDGRKNAFYQTITSIKRIGNEYRLMELRERKESCVYFSFEENYDVETVVNDKVYIPLRELALEGEIPVQGEMEVCKQYITITASDGDTTIDIDSEGNESILDGDINDNNISKPVIASINYTSSFNTITVAVDASDKLNEIVKYHYYINGELKESLNSNTYKFTNLKANKDYKIKVVVENGLGLKATKEIYAKTKGLEAPTFTIDTAAWASKKTLTINYSMGNDYTYEYMIINGETEEGQSTNVWIKASNPTTLHFKTNGNIQARISDSEGNSMEANYTISNIDTTKPTISLASTATTSTVTLSANCNDPETGIKKVEFSRDGSTWDDNGTNQVKTYTALSTGNYTFHVRCTNGVGLSNNQSKTVMVGSLEKPTLTIDNTDWVATETGKTLTITYPEFGNYSFKATGNFQITSGNATNNDGTYTTSDKVIKLKFKNNGFVTAFVSDGTNTVNNSYTISKIDTTAPVTSLDVRATTNSATLTATCKDDETNISKIEFSKDGKTWDDNKTSTTKTYSNLKTGKYTFYVRCTNGVLMSNTANETNDTLALEEPIISLDTTSWATSKTATITYSGTGEYSFKTTGDFEITEGTANKVGDVYKVTTNVIKLKFKSNGLITAYVSDGVNTVQKDYTISNIDTTKPVISISSSVTTSSVTLTANCSDPETGIKKIEFSKDGKTWEDNGTNALKTYNNLNSGTHTFYAKCTNGVNVSNQTSKDVTLNTLNVPTFEIDNANWVNNTTGKVLTITYSSAGTHTFTSTGTFTIYEGNATKNGDTYTVTGSSVKLKFTTNGSVTAYVSDGTNTVNSSYTISKIDTTKPTISLSSTSTTSSVTLTANCSDPETDIKKIEFSKDGSTWEDNGTNALKTYSKLTSGTYTFYSRCTNGVGLMNETNKNVILSALESPTIEIDNIDWANNTTGKTVTITYPSIGTHTFKATGTFEVTSGNTTSSGGVYTVTGNTVKVKFKTNGSISAKVSDGTNTKQTDYTISKIDTTAPTTSLNVTTTTNSATLTATCNDLETNISKIEFSKDGNNWDDNGTNNTKVYNNLKTGTYTFYTRCTNGVGMKNQISKSNTTEDLVKPSITISTTDWAINKVITITYSGVGTYTFIPTGSIEIIEGSATNSGGTYTTLDTTVKLKYTSNGSVTAYVSDGINTVSQSYTISKIDTTGPTISLSSTKTTSSITLTANCKDDETGIKKIEFSKDGKTWDNNDTNPTKVYDNLKTGTYTMYAKCTNGINVTNQTSKEITLDTLEKPQLSIDNINWATNKVLTITYPSIGTHTFKATGAFEIVEGSATNNAGTYTVTGDLVKLKFSETGSVTAYVSDGSNTVNASYTVTQIDTTKPTISLASSKTSSSVTLTATCEDNETGISKIEFSSDGSNWTNNGTNKTKTYENLKTGTYTFYARCTNGVGLLNSANKEITLDTLDKPTFTLSEAGWVSNTTGKTVTITYPSIGTHTFTANGIFTIVEGGTTQSGNVYTVTGDTVKLKFTTDGSVSAKVSDGTNSMQSDYIITKIDTTAPTTSLDVKTTSNSATLTTTCKDDETNISKIEFSKDGINWDNNGTNNVKTYSNLTTGTYTFYTRCTNGVGMSSTTSKTNATASLVKPTLSIDTYDWSTSKTITITYSGAGTYTFSGTGTFTIVEGTATKNDNTYTTTNNIIKLKFTDNGSVTAFVSDGTNTLNESYTISKIDTTLPTISLASTNTTSSITLTATCADPETGISKIEFSKDGTTWDNNGVSEIKTYSNLKSGSYKMYARCTNSVGLINETSKNINLDTLTKPTFTIDNLSWANNTDGKTLTITYPVNGNHTFTVTGTFIIAEGDATNNGGTYTVNSNTIKLKFTTNGSVTAYVSDSVNEVSNSYTISQIDTTIPTVSLASSVTTNSVTLTTTCDDEETGISKIEFSKDGMNWENNGVSTTKTYSNLQTGTYKYYTRCTNGVGMTNQTNKDVTLDSISKPTYSIDKTGWQTSKILTITYPSNGNHTFKGTGNFTIYEGNTTDNSGTYTVIGNTVKLKFTSAGSITAYVSDGTNTVQADYTIEQIDNVTPTVTITPTVTNGSNGWVTSASIKATISAKGSSTTTLYRCLTTSATCDPITEGIQITDNDSLALANNAQAQTVCAQAINEASTKSAITCSDAYKVDNQTPTITANAGTFEITQGDNVLVSTYFTASWGVSGTGTLTCTPTNTSGLAAGTQTVKCKATGVNGKVSTEASKSITVKSKGITPDTSYKGKWVAYTPDNATWDTARDGVATSTQSSQGKFDIYDVKTGKAVTGQSKNNSITCYNSSYVNKYSGWVIMNVDANGTMTLLHAGTPECYYHGSDSANSVNILATASTASSPGTGKAWTKYGNASLAQSVHYMTYDDFKTTSGKSDPYNQCDSSGCDNIPTVNIGSYYWLASQYSTNALYVWYASLRLVNYDSGISYGVRPVVVLKSGVKIGTTGSGTMADPYQLTN